MTQPDTQENQASYAAEPVSFAEAIKICLINKYFVFSGRASRSEFWSFAMLAFAIALFIPFIGLAFCVPCVAAGARRLHDTGRKGVWSWLLLAVGPGTLAVLILWGVITALTGAYFPFNPGNEGERTPPGHFTNYFSSFGGNLLCWSYERYPSGTLTRSLIDRYGVPNGVLYMYWSYFHQKKTAMLARLQKDFPDFFPGGKRQFR